jgi:hypothetical protein
VHTQDVRAALRNPARDLVGTDGGDGRTASEQRVRAEEELVNPRVAVAETCFRPEARDSISAAWRLASIASSWRSHVKLRSKGDFDPKLYANWLRQAGPIETPR